MNICKSNQFSTFLFENHRGVRKSYSSVSALYFDASTLHCSSCNSRAESPGVSWEHKTFSVQGSRTDGFSETSSMFAAAKVVSSARPLAGHAVTLARVEKYTPVGGERVRGCVCKEIPSKTPRSRGYREPHGKHRPR